MTSGPGFSEVIVPLDGSELSAHALVPACTIAKHLDVPMRVVSFHPPAADGDELRQIIDEQLEHAGGMSPNVEIASLDSSVSEQLEPILAAAPDALVAMSTRGRGHSAALLGSVANEILATFHRPVVLIGPSCATATFRTDGPMVVAADRGPGTAAVLDLAAGVLAAFDYTAQIVNVLDPDMANAMERSRGGPEGTDLPHESAMAHRYANELGRASGQEIDYVVLHAKHPGPAIADHAADQGAALIAMATHARTGLRRLTLGSVTAEVVARASCPVLATAPAKED
jgi:nucleotide-binding universal stress UspA family protein